MLISLMPEKEANFEVEQEVLEGPEVGHGLKSSVGKPLEHRDKVVLLVISGVGVAVLLLAYLQILVNIRSAFNPLKFKPAQQTPSVAMPYTSISNAAGQDLVISEDLKLKDTDGDGLNDFDELTIYKTSPYLDDSDSDKLPDGKEVQNGTDPNCPEGKVCRQQSEVGANVNVPSFVTNPPQPSSSFQSQLREAVPIEKLRELLITQGGMTKEQVDQIDDDTLRKIYEQTLSDLSQQTNQ